MLNKNQALLIGLGLCILSSVFAQSPQGVFAPVAEIPELGSKAFILRDFDSGKILASRNPEELVEPASITKMMSAYVVFQALKNKQLDLAETVKINEKAYHMQGSRMFVELNSEVDVKSLIIGMVVQSGNDATVALAERVGGSEEKFVQNMNEVARHLGMNHTHFINSTGWPTKDHYTTAYDIALLSEALIRDFPDYYTWFSHKEFTHNKIRQYNRNRLLWRDEAVDGIKTGHTDSAGFCLAASARKNGMRLIAVVFGASDDKSRAADNLALLNYGFSTYETHRLYHASQSLQSAKVWKGQRDQVELGLAKDVYITIPRGYHERLNTEVVYREPIIAPVKKGQAFGSLKVTLSGKEIVSAPVYSLEAVKSTGFWGRAVDEVKLWFD